MSPRSPDGRDHREPGDPFLAPLDGRPGPARRLAPAVSAEMVRSVLERALETPIELVPDPPPPREALRWRRALAFAAAVLLAISVGSGASAVALRLVDIQLGEPELAPEPSPRPSPPVAHQHAAPPPPQAAQEVEIPAEVVLPPEPAPAPPVRRTRRKRPHAIVVTEVPPAPAPAPAPPPPGVVPENLPPADLLAFANVRRTRREWREADLFYRATVSRFPGTDAAMVAAVASASLHLQHLDDAAGALAIFQRTLGARQAGPVAEEARWGIAEAHRALGDPGAEALALRDFLRHHPTSALAPAAERRLRRLGR